MMHRSLLSAALGVLAAGSASAAETPALTIYRADADTLFENGGSPVADGYAVVHEQRAVKFPGSGRQTVFVDGLPATLDAEAVSIDFGAGPRVLAQRVLSIGDGGSLAAHRGEEIQTVTRGGVSMTGTLVGVDGGALILRDSSGKITYVREYDSVRFTQGTGLPGSTLQLVVDGGSGDVPATLTYPTSGLGWRAAYSASLIDGGGCRLRLDALASIANRSGRDFAGAKLKLVAGSPNIARSGGPRPMAYKAMASTPAPEELPEQSSLGDYRSYTVDGILDLPDSSVTQVPLYAPRETGCERRWIVENGGAWFPPKPMIAPNDVHVANGPVLSELGFKTDDNLPAGQLRVLTRDRDNRTEFLGEARIADTQKGRGVNIALGNAFDLSASRERTTFSVDKADREMNEGFRITLTNTGDTARTITVREHPNRWRAWTLLSSSVKPTKQTPDLLEFSVPVPANGKATLDYAVRYHWTPTDD